MHQLVRHQDQEGTSLRSEVRSRQQNRHRGGVLQLLLIDPLMDLLIHRVLALARHPPHELPNQGATRNPHHQRRQHQHL